MQEAIGVDLKRNLTEARRLIGEIRSGLRKNEVVVASSHKALHETWSLLAKLRQDSARFL